MFLPSFALDGAALTRETYEATAKDRASAIGQVIRDIQADASILRGRLTEFEGALRELEAELSNG